MVCSTSQVDKAIRRRRNSPHTLVKISKTEYPAFTKDSIVDCNSVFENTVDGIVDLLQSRKLKHKPEMPIKIVKKLCNAVLASPIVENRIKEILQSYLCQKGKS